MNQNCLGVSMNVNGKFYSNKKKEGTGYDEKLRDCIETTCQYCIENADKSSEEKINKPIMLLGEIQSGKTRAYTGIIALAFDNGFDMVFILSKCAKNNLCFEGSWRKGGSIK